MILYKIDSHRKVEIKTDENATQDGSQVRRIVKELRDAARLLLVLSRGFFSSSSAASSVLIGPFSFSFGGAATAATAAIILTTNAFLGCDTSRLANEMQPRTMNTLQERCEYYSEYSLSLISLVAASCFPPFISDSKILSLTCSIFRSILRRELLRGRLGLVQRGCRRRTIPSQVADYTD